MGLNATFTAPLSGRALLERLKSVDGLGSGLDADTLDGLSSEDLGGGPETWQPPAINIGAMIRKGAGVSESSGAGWALRFSKSANNRVLLQVPLHTGGVPYDGASLVPVIYWGFRNRPGPGDNVLWEVEYAFIRPGADDPRASLDAPNQDTIDVSARQDDLLYLDALSTLTGKAGAVLLNLTLRRRSSGSGSDTFDEHVYLHGLTLTRA